MSDVLNFSPAAIVQPGQAVEFVLPGRRPNMRCKLVYVDREAAELLLQNAGANMGRISAAKSRKYVASLGQKMALGEFEITHHGGLIGYDDGLLDAYHRVRAIYETGLGQWIFLWHDVTKGNALDLKVDAGIGRTKDYRLGIPRSMVSTIHAAYQFAIDANAQFLTDGSLLAAAKALEPYDWMFTGRTRITGSAPYILGSLVALKERRISEATLRAETSELSKKDIAGASRRLRNLIIRWAEVKGNTWTCMVLTYEAMDEAKADQLPKRAPNAAELEIPVGPSRDQAIHQRYLGEIREALLKHFPVFSQQH